MKEKIKNIANSKIFIVIMIILAMVLVISTGTYAWFTWSSSTSTNLTMTIGEIAEVKFYSGTDINVSNLTPVYQYNYGEKTEYEIVNKEETGATIYQTIFLDIESIPTALSTSSFKYALCEDTVSGEELIASGNFEGSKDGDSIILYTGTLASDNTKYLLYIYIDGNEENDPSMMNQYFIGKLNVKASENPLLSTVIYKLYNSAVKETVVNNDITYNYAPSVSLMNDRLGGYTTSLDGGNIRYYGKSPNNYIYFNCDDYSNQSSSTCELWRIIGVFDNKVKIIRNDNIGSFSWDYDYNDDLSSKTSNNDWSTSSLQTLLNNQYYNSIDTTYYNNSTTGKAVNFNTDNKGLKNDATRNMIANMTWSLGGWNTSSVYSNDIYKYERGTTVYNGRPTIWNGKIALMYPSDYGYATDFSKCSLSLNNYNSSANSYACRTNDWLFNREKQWLLTPFSSYSFSAWDEDSSGLVDIDYNVISAFWVRPVLYLNSKLTIGSGDGTSSWPYRLSVS